MARPNLSWDSVSNILKNNVGGSLAETLLKAVSSADERAVAERVAALRQKHPQAAQDEVAEMLIMAKCWQTGAVGAVTTGASIIPGLGTLASLTFGVAADVGMTLRLQAELVLEIAALYEYQLSPTEKRAAVLLVTGLSAGTDELLSKAGTEIAAQATERLAQKTLAKAIPVLGVGASAGTNILTTYIIGRRAQAYFSLGPEAVGDWGESFRAITGLDERRLVTWLAQTTERSWGLARGGAQDLAQSMVVAGRSVGEVLVVRVEQAGDAVADAGRGVVQGVGTAAGAVVDLGKRAGEGVITSADKAGDAVTERARTAAGTVTEAGAKTRSAVVGFGGRVSNRTRAVIERITKPFKGIRGAKG